MFINFNDFVNHINESVSNYEIDTILDKINSDGIESLSDYELKLLDSVNDKSIDIDKITAERDKRHKKGMNAVTNLVPLATTDEEMEKNIGRYVKIKPTDKNHKGLLIKYGAIYEIVGIQKIWNGDKAYRIMFVGADNPSLLFGQPAKVDSIEFVNISEEEALKKNSIVRKKIDRYI